jgi:hypothetical protein
MASSALICDTEQWKALQVHQLVAALTLSGLYALISIRQQAHFWFFCFHLEKAHVGTIQKTHQKGGRSEFELQQVLFCDHQQSI